MRRYAISRAVVKKVGGRKLQYPVSALARKAVREVIPNIHVVPKD